MTDNLYFFGTALVLLVIILICDNRYPVLRDIKAPDGQQTRTVHGSYSLGRVQMAFWTVLVIAALVKLAAVNGWTIADQQIDANLLVLMGISGATGLAAMTVDVQKDKTAEDAEAKQGAAAAAAAEIKETVAQIQDSSAPAADVAKAVVKLQDELAAQELQLRQAAIEISRVTRKARAEGFFKDILEDENGNSLHRLQMVFFTLLTGTLFAINTLALAPGGALPPISEDMLALMGISNSLYVGFKIPGRSS